MARILIVYGTVEGHTADVVAALTAGLARCGHQPTAVRVDAAPDDLDAYDTLVVGSSVHVGKLHKGVLTWIGEHRAQLEARPSAFFEVCLSAASPDGGPAQAKAYVEQLTAETEWQPDLVGIFGGALLYTRYGFIKRRMMRSIAEQGGLATDTSRDVDYTDYDAVRHFAEDVGSLAIPV